MSPWLWEPRMWGHTGSYELWWRGRRQEQETEVERPQSPNLRWTQLSVIRTNVEQTPCIQKATAGAQGQEPGPDRALWVGDHVHPPAPSWCVGCCGPGWCGHGEDMLPSTLRLWGKIFLCSNHQTTSSLIEWGAPSSCSF